MRTSTYILIWKKKPWLYYTQSVPKEFRWRRWLKNCSSFHVRKWINDLVTVRRPPHCFINKTAFVLRTESSIKNVELMVYRVSQKLWSLLLELYPEIFLLFLNVKFINTVRKISVLQMWVSQVFFKSQLKASLIWLGLEPFLVTIEKLDVYQYQQ